MIPKLIHQIASADFCDALWTPVLPMPVPERAATDYGDGPDMAAGLAALTRLTRPLNYLGLPGVVVRAGFDSSDIPIGMQLAGRPFAEARLLRIAAAFEAASGLATRRPKL